MFAPGTSDQRIKERLNLLQTAYRLNDVISSRASILESEYSLENYQNSLFTSTLNNGSGGGGGGSGSGSGSSSSINLIDDSGLGSPSGVSARAFANSSNLIIGQGIMNNHGVPLLSVARIPSYSWSLKHENDDPHSHGGAGHSHSSHGSGGSGGHSSHHTSSNSSSAAYHAPSQKGKNILNGISMSDSISSLSGNVSIGVSNLNNLLIRLPLITDKTKKKKRNLNGLLYYDKEMVDRKIREINVVKQSVNSVFSQTFSETLDDVEYLHGEVILNQFLNNKRIIRNYQWMNFYLDKMGGKNLKHRVRAIEDGKINKVKTLKRAQLEMNKIKARQDFLLSNPEEAAKDKAKEEEWQQEREKSRRLRRSEYSNHFEEELEEDEEIIEAEKDGDKDVDIKEVPRFATVPPCYPDRELIIEEELSVDSVELDKYCKQLYGYQAAQQMFLHSKQTQGLIYSKIVKKRRIPNANSIGYSNIRKKRMPFTFDE